jgi:hypothetical protein
MEEYLRSAQLDDINDIGMDDDGFGEDGSASVVGNVGSDVADARKGVANLDSVSESLGRAREYVAKMLAEVDRPVAERKKLSSALVKTLGFSKLGQSTTTESERLAMKQAHRFGERMEGIPPSANPFDRFDDNLFPSPLASRYVVGNERPQEVARESEEGRRQAITRRQKLAQSEVLGSLRRQVAEAPYENMYAFRGLNLGSLGDWMNDVRDARFDPAPRNMFGDQAGRWFDRPEDWGDDADWGRRMGFRDPRNNQMEEESASDDEKEARELRRLLPASATASSYRPRLPSDERSDESEADEPQFFRSLSQERPASPAESEAPSAKTIVRPAQPAVSAPARRPVPEWLAREYQEAQTSYDYNRLAVRLTRAGFPVRVATTTKPKNARRTFKNNFTSKELGE